MLCKLRDKEELCAIRTLIRMTLAQIVGLAYRARQPVHHLLAPQLLVPRLLVPRLVAPQLLAPRLLVAPQLVPRLLVPR